MRGFWLQGKPSTQQRMVRTDIAITGFLLYRKYAYLLSFSLDKDIYMSITNVSK